MKKQIEIIIIEKVKVPDNITDTYEKLKYCEARERNWMEQLRTLEEYGGLNVLSFKFYSAFSYQIAFFGYVYIFLVYAQNFFTDLFYV